MNIVEIYKKYKIPNNLQEHLLSVTAVASVISDNFKKPLAKNDILTACLLHDVGNIIKFNFDINLFGWSDTEIEELKTIQKEFAQKYNNDEHHATIEIAKEIGVSDRVIDLLNAVGFSVACENVGHEDYEKKICSYSDMRVAPHGVVPLKKRFEDGQKRYPNKGTLAWVDEKRTCLEVVEKQIFEHSFITPDEVTDESIKSVKESLRSFEIVV